MLRNGSVSARPATISVRVPGMTRRRTQRRRERVLVPHGCPRDSRPLRCATSIPRGVGHVHSKLAPTLYRIGPVLARTAAPASFGAAWGTGRRPQPEHRIASVRVATHAFPPHVPAGSCKPVAAHRSDHTAERAHRSRARSSPSTAAPTNESILAASDARAARAAIAAADSLPGELGASVLRARLGVRRHARRVRQLAGSAHALVRLARPTSPPRRLTSSV